MSGNVKALLVAAFAVLIVAAGLYLSSRADENTTVSDADSKKVERLFRGIPQ